MLAPTCAKKILNTQVSRLVTYFLEVKIFLLLYSIEGT
jgi:hypothetical protein